MTQNYLFYEDWECNPSQGVLKIHDFLFLKNVIFHAHYISSIIKKISGNVLISFWGLIVLKSYTHSDCHWLLLLIIVLLLTSKNLESSFYRRQGSARQSLRQWVWSDICRPLCYFCYRTQRQSSIGLCVCSFCKSVRHAVERYKQIMTSLVWWSFCCIFGCECPLFVSYPTMNCNQ